MAVHKTPRNDVEEVLRDVLKMPHTSGTKAQGKVYLQQLLAMLDQRWFIVHVTDPTCIKQSAGALCSNPG